MWFPAYQAERTLSIRLFLRRPSNFLNPTYAGRYVEVFGAFYGLKDGNRLFAEKVDHAVRSAGYRPSMVAASPHTYILTDSHNSAKRSIVNVHVGDFRVLGELTTKWYTALLQRFTEIIYNSVSMSFTALISHLMIRNILVQSLGVPAYRICLLSHLLLIESFSPLELFVLHV